MSRDLYQQLSIINILNGVEEGLTKFSNTSRVALIFAPESTDDLQILDPQNILRGHDVKIKEAFYDAKKEFYAGIQTKIKAQTKGLLMQVNDLSLAGLISFGACSSDFFFQMWFTNHHPDMCSTKPTERWLEQAASLLVHDYNSDTNPIHSSDYVLKNYSLQALADYIVDERADNLDFDSKILIPPILNDILNISKTREEGAWPRGTLFFTDPQRIDAISFITRIQKHERPVITNVKHIRKLLVAVEDSNRKLVCDGCTIIGITDADIPDFTVAADFRGDYGFLKLGDRKIASFFDGSFHSTTREAKMVELEELLLDSDLDTERSTRLFQIITHLVHRAGSQRFGCTLVIDLNHTPTTLSGHILDPPLSLEDEKNLHLTRALLKMDGAIYITSDLLLHGFGCLLDGKSITWENMARGARYNSALRFSAEHDKVIVVVVSADRPVSIIYSGIEVNAFSHWRPIYQHTPKPVDIKTYLRGVKL